MNETQLRNKTIYLVRHGSVAYGTNTPLSDIDEKGVAVMTAPEYYYGFQNFEQKDSGWADETDRVIFDIRKFWNLAMDCNPNIVEVLFVDPSDYLKVTKAGNYLLSCRNDFISQKAAKTFVGYAVSQLSRMEGHYKWLNNPPTEPKEDSFMNVRSFSGEGFWEKKFNGHEVRVKTFGGAAIVHVDHEAFDAAKKDWKNYLHWKENRNKARAEIEAKYGYDCKHAYHLVRLLRMGKEILLEGKVIVKRPDKDELLAIRNGLYTYPELLEMAKDLKSEVDKAKAVSTIPVEPNREKMEQKLISLIDVCVRDPAWAFMEV